MYYIDCVDVEFFSDVSGLFVCVEVEYVDVGYEYDEWVGVVYGGVWVG